MTSDARMRRTWLVVPGHDPDLLHRAYDCQPDVLIIDLEYSVPPRYKEQVRASLPAMIGEAARFGGDVFVRIDWSTRWCDVQSAICPDLNGIVLPGPNVPGEIEEIDRQIGGLERAAGVVPGSIELALILESPNGFRNALLLAGASPRVTTLGLGRVDLTMDLGLDPEGEFRLHPYLMSRVVTVARASKKQAIGAHWREGSRGGAATAEDSFEAARRARWCGFTGSFCVNPQQVAAMSAGFTPSADELDPAAEVVAAMVQKGSAGNIWRDSRGRYYDRAKVERCNNLLLYSQDCARADQNKANRATAQRGG